MQGVASASAMWCTAVRPCVCLLLLLLVPLADGMGSSPKQSGLAGTGKASGRLYTATLSHEGKPTLAEGPASSPRGTTKTMMRQEKSRVSETMAAIAEDHEERQQQAVETNNTGNGDKEVNKKKKELMASVPDGQSTHKQHQSSANKEPKRNGKQTGNYADLVHHAHTANLTSMAASGSLLQHANSTPVWDHLLGKCHFVGTGGVFCKGLKTTFHDREACELQCHSASEVPSHDQMTCNCSDVAGVQVCILSPTAFTLRCRKNVPLMVGMIMFSCLFVAFTIFMFWYICTTQHNRDGFHRWFMKNVCCCYGYSYRSYRDDYPPPAYGHGVGGHPSGMPYSGGGPPQGGHPPPAGMPGPPPAGMPAPQPGRQ